MKPDTHSADPRQRARVLVVDDHAVVRAGVVSMLRTRVLVLTSFADRLRLERARSAGAVGYVLKDGEPGELLARVRRLAFEVA